VARVAIRCIRDAFRSTFGNEEPERIAVGKDRRVKMTLFDQLGEDVATGEFSGTSISSKPLSISVPTMDSASPGRMPRRMAMSGRFTVGQGTGSVMS
jgi:hypothetical protein